MTVISEALKELNEKIYDDYKFGLEFYKDDNDEDDYHLNLTYNGGPIKMFELDSRDFEDDYDSDRINYVLDCFEEELNKCGWTLLGDERAAVIRELYDAVEKDLFEFNDSYLGFDDSFVLSPYKQESEETLNEWFMPVGDKPEVKIHRYGKSDPNWGYLTVGDTTLSDIVVRNLRPFSDALKHTDQGKLDFLYNSEKYHHLLYLLSDEFSKATYRYGEPRSIEWCLSFIDDFLAKNGYKENL